jgi:hypothetical protein
VLFYYWLRHVTFYIGVVFVDELNTKFSVALPLAVMYVIFSIGVVYSEGLVQENVMLFVLLWLLLSLLLHVIFYISRVLIAMLLFCLLRHVDVRACAHVCGLMMEIRPRLRASRLYSYFKDAVFRLIDTQYVYILE